MKPDPSELMLGVAATAGLGTPFLFIALAQQAMSTPVMAAVRVVLAAAALLVLLAGRSARRASGRQGTVGVASLVGAVRRHPVAVLVVALTAAVAPNLLIGGAEHHVPSGTAATILATTPLWIATISALSRSGDRMRARQWAALPVAVTGVALAAGAAVPAGAWGWCLVPLACAIGYAISNLTVRRHLADVDPLTLAAAEMTIGATVLIPVAVIDATVHGGPQWQPTAWIAVAAAGIGCSGLGWLANTALVQRVGAARSSYVSYTAVLVSILLGAMALDEPLGARVLVGAFILVVAVAAFLTAGTFTMTPKRKIRMLELSILGFLAQEPLHAYELRRRISALTGHVRTVSDGALNPALRRLTDRGLLRAHQEPGVGGPPRTVFELTDAGREELRRRLAEPGQLEITDRNHFFVVLAFLHHLSDPGQQRQVLQRRLTFLEAPGRGFFVPEDRSRTSSLFRDGMLTMARATWTAERTWLRRTLASLEVPG